MALINIQSMTHVFNVENARQLGTRLVFSERPSSRGNAGATFPSVDHGRGVAHRLARRLLTELWRACDGPAPVGFLCPRVEASARTPAASRAPRPNTPNGAELAVGAPELATGAPGLVVSAAELALPDSIGASAPGSAPPPPASAVLESPRAVEPQGALPEPIALTGS
jgi:hypothetical protein